MTTGQAFGALHDAIRAEARQELLDELLAALVLIRDAHGDVDDYTDGVQDSIYTIEGLLGAS